jgi:hypothetical protein
MVNPWENFPLEGDLLYLVVKRRPAGYNINKQGNKEKGNEDAR